jgi:hypothetical protein
MASGVGNSHCRAIGILLMSVNKGMIEFIVSSAYL